MENISIIIPTYNEKDNILNLINSIKNNISSKYEIIFADDNSNDGTLEIFKKIKIKNIKYIIHKGPNNLSKSVIIAARLCRYENIIVMDGDLQHDPKYLNKIIDKYKKEKSDIVVACRNFKKIKGLSFIRIITSRLLIRIVNIIVGNLVSDPMSGYFFIKKKIFIRSIPKLYAKGFKILLDLISVNKNCKIDEVSIKFKTRLNNHSKMSIKILFNLMIFIIRDLFKIK